MNMQEILAEHQFSVVDESGYAVCTCGETIIGTGESWEEFTTHQAEQLAANGYGKLEDAWDEGRRYALRNLANGGGSEQCNPYRRPE